MSHAQQQKGAHPIMQHPNLHQNQIRHQPQVNKQVNKQLFIILFSINSQYIRCNK